MVSIAAAATLACIYEATAPKPGNVHPGARFVDIAYEDFVASAVVIGPIVARAASRGVGHTVLDAVRATRSAVGSNTNLGTLLLLAPLAGVTASRSLQDGIGSVLERLDETDTRLVFEAVRLSAAGGLGRAAVADVHADPPPGLRLVDAMRLAADRDLVARQYTNGFADVFDGTAAWIAAGLGDGWPLSTAIVAAHLRMLAAAPDSLIQRKSGPRIAHEASERARAILASGGPGHPIDARSLADFDDWLRADGNRRNPGSTADLIAAGLFVLLREDRLCWRQW